MKEETLITSDPGKNVQDAFPTTRASGVLLCKNFISTCFLFTDKQLSICFSFPRPTAGAKIT